MAKVIVFVTMSLWDEPHRGRHHYANLLSDRNTVIWINRHLRPGEQDVRPGIQHIKNGLYVLHAGKPLLPTRLDNRLNINNRFRLRLLRRELARLNIKSPDVVWCYDHKGAPFVRAYGGRAVCLYFCNDWFGNWTSYPRHEKTLASIVDHVFAVSPKLCARFEPLNRNTHFVPHGLWLPDATPVYSKKPRPETVGYVGTLNNTVDTDLLEKIINETECDLLLAGPIVEASPPKRAAFQRLINHPRVKYLGDLGKREADHARSLVDVLLLPYVKNIVREYGFPIKYFEYLGAGKPILSTDYMTWPDPFCDTMHVFREQDDLRTCIAQAYQRWNEDCFNNAMALARKSTWECRVATISELIGVAL